MEMTPEAQPKCAICGIDAYDTNMINKWLNYGLSLREIPDLENTLCTDCIAKLKDDLFALVFGGVESNKTITLASLRKKCMSVTKLNHTSKVRLANFVSQICNKFATTVFHNDNDDDDANRWYDDVTDMISSVASVYGYKTHVDIQEVDDNQRVINIMIHEPSTDTWYRMPIPASRHKINDQNSNSNPPISGTDFMIPE